MLQAEAETNGSLCWLEHLNPSCWLSQFQLGLQLITDLLHREWQQSSGHLPLGTMVPTCTNHRQSYYVYKFTSKLNKYIYIYIYHILIICFGHDTIAIVKPSILLCCRHFAAIHSQFCLQRSLPSVATVEVFSVAGPRMANFDSPFANVSGCLRHWLVQIHFCEQGTVETGFCLAQFLHMFTMSSQGHCTGYRYRHDAVRWVSLGTASVGSMPL